MFKNYLKIVVRNLFKHKLYAFINVFGLAVGLVCCVLILLFVRDELSYDRYHDNAGRIFRLVRTTSALSAAPMAPALARDFPQIENAVRFVEMGRVAMQVNRQETFYETRGFFADSSVFSVFSFPLVQGNPSTALREPFSMVITESLARKYFGDKNPIGQVMQLTQDEKFELKITGVARDVPPNSHFRFDFLVSFKTLEQFNPRLENWTTNWLHSYLLFDDPDAVAAVQTELPAFFERHTGGSWKHFRLQALTDVHLHSEVKWEIEPQGSIARVYAFSAVALVILIIACINFTSLVTARAIERGKEVGIRKVVGAARNQLIGQFLGESFVFAFLGLIAALGMVELILPAFNQFTGKELELNLTGSPILMISSFLLLFFVSIAAGAYPAFMLSAFRPVETLKDASPVAGGARFRKVLLVFQFAASIVLITATLVVEAQLDYMQSKRLGFDREQVVVLPFGEQAGDGERYALIKDELRKHASINAVAACSNIPGEGVSDHYYRLEGITESEDDFLSFNTFIVDHDYLPLLDIEVIAGRNFSSDLSSDQQAFLLNETAARKAAEQAGQNWRSLIGRQLDFHIPGREGWRKYKSGPVIGIVKDFHYASLHEAIEPLAIQMLPSEFEQVLVKLRGEELSATIAFLQDVWQRFNPDRPFEYSFLDQKYQALYQDEQRLGQLFTVFSALAIVVACLGLLGLSTFAAQRRTKEIGVRKVLGASLAHLISVLSKDFLKLVLLANLIAWPLAYFAMTNWLQNFAYRIDMSWWTFALAGGMALLIALLTVSTQAVRAALANPVESLRYE